MSPITHLLASWLVAAKTTDNPRDRCCVTLAGVIPDLDGAGLLLDMADGMLGRPIRYYYFEYHHFLLHGLAAALALAAAFALVSRRRGRVFLLTLLVFHLHLLCDLVGSRGPDAADVWTIPYLGPFSHDWTWRWAGQWPLHAWPNRLLTGILLAFALWLPVRSGHSVVGVFNRRADAAVVEVLRRWAGAFRGWIRAAGPSP